MTGSMKCDLSLLVDRTAQKGIIAFSEWMINKLEGSRKEEKNPDPPARPAICRFLLLDDHLEECNRTSKHLTFSVN